MSSIFYKFLKIFIWKFFFPYLLNILYNKLKKLSRIGKQIFIFRLHTRRNYKKEEGRQPTAPNYERLFKPQSKVRPQYSHQKWFWPQHFLRQFPTHDSFDHNRQTKCLAWLPYNLACVDSFLSRLYFVALFAEDIFSTIWFYLCPLEDWGSCSIFLRFRGFQSFLLLLRHSRL